MSLPRLATTVATLTALVLAVAKVVVGFMSGSVAVIASALDSILDMVISIFNNIAVRVSESKPDHKFNYGKGKIEGLAALFEGLFISASGLFIIYEGIRKIIHHEAITEINISIYVMLFSMLATLALVLFLAYVVKKTNHLVIKSDLLHYKTDLLTNGAVLVSLIVVKLTGWYYIDFILSILIGIYIIKEASEIVKEGFEILLDVSLDFETVEKIKEIIKKEPLVLDYHCLRTRKAGNRNFVDVHLVLTPDMKLKLAHTIIENVEDKIRAIDPDKKWIINIHADPYDDSHINKLLEECE
ncbi:cation diffusion facilitator family transporter [Caminibacter pacificus]|uniref:Cation diffusion facilitator family transporter n=1 Tax=Caminibacter pacificus TaxID=1424653 RepID=A0AAJ4RCJ3_9BACT|nr:cation diffusion facilitator family transporter [Caminibacter pacificus]NPA87980.1 cation transporter [Campylobacterota bacterium]QCI27980.1 cation transporter [Caminibacter pacificus]ROR39834.1 cation diffusion facilitator family transporter [Caminibacter pacificus]